MNANTGRELMFSDEVRTLPNEKALLFIRGELSVCDRKYDIEKHPRYKLTEDGGAAPYPMNVEVVYYDDFTFSFDSYEDIEFLE